MHIMGLTIGTIIPAIVTLIVHVIVFGALFVSWEGQAPPKRVVPPSYIKATLVQLDSKVKKKASAKKKPRKVDLTAKRKAQERLKREAEKKRLTKAKMKKDAAAKKAAAKKKKDDEAKRKKEKERQQLESEKRLQQEFEQALAVEEGLLLDEEYATEAQSFSSKLEQRVGNNWNRPPSARKGMRCTLAIRLVPTGRIVSVTVTEGSGNSAFDRAAVQAVKKVEVFPEVKEMSPEVFERYYRKFNFLFDPQDLRL